MRKNELKLESFGFACYLRFSGRGKNFGQRLQFPNPTGERRRVWVGWEWYGAGTVVLCAGSPIQGEALKGKEIERAPSLSFLQSLNL